MKIERTCKHCSVIFLKDKKYVNRGQGVFCSIDCRNKSQVGKFDDPDRFKDGKKCTQCLKILPVEDFSSRNPKPGQVSLHSWCKNCFNKHNTIKYRANPKACEEARINKAILREKNQIYIFNLLKKSSCMDCGETDIIVLDFDHRDPSKKEFSISAAMCASTSMNKIKIEIEKCDIVCSNCHRRRTAKQFGYYKYKMALKDGIEPPTPRSSDGRSTTELLELK